MPLSLRLLFPLAIAAIAATAPAYGQDPRSGLALRAPITTWDEAIPLGNGTLGALVWGGDSTVIISLDRGDLWDERRPAIFSDPQWNWRGMIDLVRTENMARFHQLFDDPYERLPYPTKLPAGRLELVWSGRIIERFELDLAIAEARVIAGTDTLRVAVLADRNAILIDGKDIAPRLIPPAGLSALTSDTVRWTVSAVPHSDQLGTTFEQPVAGGMSFAVSTWLYPRQRWSIEATISSLGPMTERTKWAIGTNAGLLAANVGWDSAVAGHRKYWRAFWSISSVTLPDTALQRHYDLAKYFYGSAARDGSPPIPLQGVWTADEGGLPPWKGDYHNDLNTQMTYRAAHAAGLTEVTEGWLTYLEERLPEFRRFAKEFYGVDGAVIPGVMSLAGKPLGGWGMYSLSPTNGAWVAWSFCQHWRVTNDANFLGERAYPFMKEIGTALAALLVKSEEDGRMRLPLSSSPEWGDNDMQAFLSPNSSYDGTLLRWLFTTLEEMARALELRTEADQWHARALYVHVPDITAVDKPTVVAEGQGYDASHRHFSHAMSIWPLELRPFHQGITDATIDELAARGTRQWTGYSFAWYAAMLASVGRADSALRYLKDYTAFTSRNGFHLNGDQSGRELSSFTYRPFTLEGNFIAMDAVHEMLLQTRAGVMRLFPAVPDAWRDVSFERLRAEGGWIVSAKRVGGQVVEVEITSEHGGELQLAGISVPVNMVWAGTEMHRFEGAWHGVLPPGGRVRGRVR